MSNNETTKQEVQWFEKLPLRVQAVRVLNREYADNPLVFDVVPDWLQEAVANKTIVPEFRSEDYWYYRIKTLEGEHLASPGDWIIRGVKGELYPCKPDIFAQTYKPVSTPSSAATPEPLELGERLKADPYAVAELVEKIKKPAAPPPPSAEQELITKLVERLEDSREALEEGSLFLAEVHVRFGGVNLAKWNDDTAEEDLSDYTYGDIATMLERRAKSIDAILSEVAAYRKEKP